VLVAGRDDTVWMGLVLSHGDDYVWAQRNVEESPTVNDLARLLADAMQRPLAGRSHRPRGLYLRARPEWAELLPHLKQLGIQVVSQHILPKWDRTFGDLQAQVEQARAAPRQGRVPDDDFKTTRKEKAMVRSRKPTAAHPSAEHGHDRLYTLEVFLFNGPITEEFAKKNPVVSRTIQMRGDQTLEDLHQAIFDAFGRWDEHLYEFQFGKGPMDPKARRYVLPNAFEDQSSEDNPPAGRVDTTTLDALGLKVGDRFGYWFDFGDDWWHQINVEGIGDKMPRGKFPKVTKRVGKNPPQYAEEDE
jgi:Plasmid pRiA4b ORF-3-like protein